MDETLLKIFVTSAILLLVFRPLTAMFNDTGISKIGFKISFVCSVFSFAALIISAIGLIRTA